MVDHGFYSFSQGKRRTAVQINAEKFRQSVMLESYEKELEFPADGPGRVIVRLERLMGTDKIRMTDSKYMTTLLQRLEEEEEQTWRKRTRERRKAEHNRFRQLVIDGYTEPGPEMQDLYNHPVFRVNRILNRLSKLNRVTPILSLPPIIPIDPFKYDDTGKVFRFYPGHMSLRHANEYTNEERVSSYKIMDHLMYTGPEVDEGKARKEVEDIMINDNTEKEPVVDSSEGQMKEKQGSPESDIKSSDEGDEELPRMLTLQEIQRKYGVAPNADLGTEWKPYQSHIVNHMFEDEDRGVWDLYELGKDISTAYERQQEVADDYFSALESGETQEFFMKRRRILRNSMFGNEDEDEVVEEKGPDDVQISQIQNESNHQLPESSSQSPTVARRSETMEESRVLANIEYEE